MSGEDARQYLTFTLGAEEYGVDILSVQEIRGWSPITPIPNMPRYLKGVVNLRGTVVPIVDLRSKLSMPEVEPTPFTVVIMIRAGAKATGLLVDAVSDVVTVPAATVEPPPTFGEPGEAGASVIGTARMEDKLIVLLDVARLLAADESATREALA
jgi:purine-binding chemotaxis protein CheW